MILSPQEIFVAFVQQKPLFYENWTVLGQNNIGQIFTQQNFRTLQKIASLLSNSLFGNHIISNAQNTISFYQNIKTFAEFLR